MCRAGLVSQGGFGGARYGTRANCAGDCGDGREQAFARAETVRVAERDGESVGGVGRLGVFGQAESGGDHLLHLLFGCGAVAGDAGLHFARRIAVRGDGRLRGGEQHHAADFGEFERGAHIERGENGLDGDGVWRELRNQLSNQFVDFAEARGEGGARGKFQGAEAQQARGGADEFDHAIACGAGDGGVNAEHAEARDIPRRVRRASRRSDRG